MKILVRRGRVDPIVTSQQNAPAQVVQEEVTESELNSEVELLNSQDLLRRVVLATGLQRQQGSWRSILGRPSDDVAIAMAVRQLGETDKNRAAEENRYDFCQPGVLGSQVGR